MTANKDAHRHALSIAVPVMLSESTEDLPNLVEVKVGSIGPTDVPPLGLLPPEPRAMPVDYAGSVHSLTLGPSASTSGPSGWDPVSQRTGPCLLSNGHMHRAPEKTLRGKRRTQGSNPLGRPPRNHPRGSGSSLTFGQRRYRLPGGSRRPLRENQRRCQ